MKINELINQKYFKDIPKKGYIFIVLSCETIFEKYSLENGEFVFDSNKPFDIREIKELHCFDSEIEYRLRVVNRGKEYIENIIRKSEEIDMNKDLLYEDEMIIKPEYVKSSEGLHKIKVINRYKYTYYDTLVLDGYRMSCDNNIGDKQ